jgi:hypothetical protein
MILTMETRLTQHHQHLLVEATLEANITDEDFMKYWLNLLVQKVNMQVFGGPYVKYCNDPENEGMSGFIRKLYR